MTLLLLVLLFDLLFLFISYYIFFFTYMNVSNSIIFLDWALSKAEPSFIKVFLTDCVMVVFLLDLLKVITTT